MLTSDARVCMPISLYIVVLIYSNLCTQLDQANFLRTVYCSCLWCTGSPTAHWLEYVGIVGDHGCDSEYIILFWQCMHVSSHLFHVSSNSPLKINA